MRDAHRAALAGVVHACIWLLGTPGLDYLADVGLDQASTRAELLSEVGEVAHVAFAIDGANRALREPIVKLLAPLQRPFRISQEWNLYRDGPARFVILEIFVDGKLRFRTADAEHAWLAPQLRNRHVRAVVESTATKRDSPNWRGLARYIVARARAEDPNVSEVELRSQSGPFPGTTLKTGHRIVARAPSFTPVMK